MYFAIETADIRITQQTLDQHIGEADPALRWFALLDLAFVYEERQARKALDALSPARLYHLHPLDKLSDASPALVALAATPSERYTQLRTLLVRREHKPMLAFIASTLDANQIRDQWQASLYPDCGEGQRFLLRFADTRIAPVLPTALSARNWARLTQGLAHWLIIDRHGALVPLPLAGAPATPSTEVPMQLAQDEIDALLASGMADAVIGALEDLDPHVLPSERRGDFHRHIQEVCQFAAQHRVESFPDITALALASCLTQGGVLTDARLPQRLAEPYAPGQLGAKLAELLESPETY